MPDRCVAGYCTSDGGNGVSMHHFPKDATIQKAWVRAVKNTRKWDGPIGHSVLCGNHFTEECFETSSVMKKKLGFTGM